MSGSPLLLVAAAVALLIAVMLVGMFSRGPKITETTAVRMDTARKINLRFSRSAEWTKNKKWAEGPFGIGAKRRGEDIMFGLYNDRPIATFHHKWELPLEKKRDVLVDHMVAGVWIGGTLPLIRVLREQGVPDMPGDVPTGSPMFDSKYRVICKDTDAVAEVFTPNVTRFVLSNDKHVGEFWLENGWLFTAWEPGPHDDMTDIAEHRYYLSFITGLAKMIPERLRAGDAVRGPHGSALADEAVKDLFPNLRVS